MIPAKTPVQEYRDFVLNKKWTEDSRKYRGFYYRALMESSKVKRAHLALKKGDYISFRLWCDAILAEPEAFPKRDATLVSILKFHLNKFTGEPITPEVLDSIRDDMRMVVEDVFGDKDAIKLNVESTPDKKFRVVIDK